MASIGEKLQHADWKSEKHVPVIDCPEMVKTGELTHISVTIGKEIPHPNTVEHHIMYITLYYLADGEKNPYQIGHYEFSGHGESVAGANQGPVHTEPAVTTAVKLAAPGTLYAVSFCNIHGLWESTQAVRVG